MSGDEERRGRSADEVTLEMLRSAVAEVTALIKSRLPRSFPKGDGVAWELVATAFLSRLSTTLESLVDLTGTPYEYAIREVDGTVTYETREESVGLSPKRRGA